AGVFVSKVGVQLIRQSRDDQVGPAVIVLIVEHHAHAGKGAPVPIVRGARSQRDILEGPAAQIPEQKLTHRVVRYEDVDSAVSVEVGDGDAQRLAGRIGD